nr:unnamed protein product [Callosobruchus analis]
MHLRANILPKNFRDAAVTAFTFSVIPLIYYFELFVVLPRYYEQWSSGYNFHFSTGTFILFNICANLVAIMLCDTSIKGRLLPADLKPDWRYCTVCETIAPPRSWHCETCNICILKRDHHCIFTSCCIGHDNHRYFLMFVIYVFISTIYASYYNVRFLIECFPYTSWKSFLKIVFPLAMLFMEWTELQVYIFFIMLVTFVGLFTGVLSYFHLDLMLRGTVTHQRKEKDKYDRGKLENTKVVLGERWYLVWLCPWIESKLPCDGVHWNNMLSSKVQ